MAIDFGHKHSANTCSVVIAAVPIQLEDKTTLLIIVSPYSKLRRRMIGHVPHERWNMALLHFVWWLCCFLFFF